MMKQACVCLALFLMADAGLALGQLGSFLVPHADISICLMFSVSRKLEERGTYNLYCLACEEF